MEENNSGVDIKATIKKIRDEDDSQKMNIGLLLMVRQQAYEIAQRPLFEYGLQGQQYKNKYIMLGMLCDDLLTLHRNDIKEGSSLWNEAMNKEFYVNIVPLGFRVEVPEETRYSR